METNQAMTGRRFDVKFFTNLEEYSVADTVYQLSGASTGSELNQLINTLLEESSDEWIPVEFDFVVEGTILRESLEEHLEEVPGREDGVSSEKEVKIEYVRKEEAPKACNSLQHEDWVSCVDCNDTYLVSGCYDGFLHIWTLSGDHKVAIPAHPAPIKAVSWLPCEGGDTDHFIVSAGHDEVLNGWKWSPKSNKVESVFTGKGHSRSVDCLSVNQDLVASGSFDKLLKIWSVSNDGEEEGDENEAGSSRLKGRKKVKKDDGSSRSVVGKRTLTPLITLSGHSEAVTGVRWLSDEDTESIAPEVVSCSMDNTMRIWDIEVSQVKQTVVGSKSFLSVSFNPRNNLLVTGSTDRHIRLWDPRASEGKSVISNFTSHSGWIPTVDWSKSSDFLFISGSYDGSVKHWDTRSPKASLYDLLGHKDKVLTVTWANPLFIVTGSADNQVKIFSA